MPGLGKEDLLSFVLVNGVPKGIRTPVTAVKGRCPRPLDDGDETLYVYVTALPVTGRTVQTNTTFPIKQGRWIKPNGPGIWWS